MPPSNSNSTTTPTRRTKIAEEFSVTGLYHPQLYTERSPEALAARVTASGAETGAAGGRALGHSNPH